MFRQKPGLLTPRLDLKIGTNLDSLSDSRIYVSGPSVSMRKLFRTMHTRDKALNREVQQDKDNRAGVEERTNCGTV
jgi:hypothetical protein